MYIPAAYRADSPEIAAAVMTRHPFATLISSDASGPVATHIPIRFDATRGSKGSLFGHVARSNSHAALFTPDRPALAIFHGPHAYVSPTWYVDHPAVPTWNHVSVHVHGTIRVISDPETLHQQLRLLVETFESGPGAWSMDSVPPEFLQRMAAGIVAFELSIDRIETQCKLSQKRSAADQSQVRQALRASGRPDELAVAAWMESYPLPPSML